MQELSSTQPCSVTICVLPVIPPSSSMAILYSSRATVMTTLSKL
ncbi:hypothetical protein EVA_17107 [gut metagenome]|uniref:Uncharacterized protein n=1 Tax=gut metagenome TaxID=749906 RepID=J9G5I8_9ZZZZ